MKKITHAVVESAYETLCAKTAVDFGYFFLISCATLICFFGFRMNSPSAIIGAMVVSPLLLPIVSTGAAVYRRDWKVLRTAFSSLTLGVANAFTVAFVASILFHIPLQSEIVDRIAGDPLDYFMIAMFSGAAGTFAFYWPDLLEAVAGIAISVALLPPVVMISIGLSQGNPVLAGQAALIAAINVLGIVIASCLVTAIIMRWKGR